MTVLKGCEEEIWNFERGRRGAEEMGRKCIVTWETLVIGFENHRVGYKCLCLRQRNLRLPMHSLRLLEEP